MGLSADLTARDDIAGAWPLGDPETFQQKGFVVTSVDKLVN